MTRPHDDTGGTGGTGLVFEDPARFERTMLRLFGSTPTPPAGEQADQPGEQCRAVLAGAAPVPDGPVEALGVTARGLDELAAVVEAELGYEAGRLAAAQKLTNDGGLQELLEAHAGRRRTVLRLVASVLGELHGDLEDVSAAVAGLAAAADRVALVPEAVLAPDGVLVAAEQAPNAGASGAASVPGPAETDTQHDQHEQIPGQRAVVRS